MSECQASGGGVGGASRSSVSALAHGRRARVVAGDRRLQPRAGEKGGSATGPSPVDRARLGSKHHLLVESSGIPLAWTLSGGNRNDVTQLVPLLERVPPVRGKVGRPRRRPERVTADRGYDHEKYRRQLRPRGTAQRSPAVGQSTAPGWGASAGSSSAPSPGCITSSACSSATTAATRSTKPSSPSAAASSASEDSADAREPTRQSAMSAGRSIVSVSASASTVASTPSGIVARLAPCPRGNP